MRTRRSQGTARAPRAHDPDHAGHRARRRHGERRVHADRHDARRGRRPVRRRLRRHRRRRHRARPRSTSTSSDWTVKPPDGRRLDARARPLRPAGRPPPSATSPTRPRSSPATASRPATARTSASGFDSRTDGRRGHHPVPARLGPLGHRRRARSSSTPSTAEKQHYARRLEGPHHHARRGAQYYDVVGIARFGTVKSLGTATAAVFDLRTAQDAVRQGAAATTRSSSPARRRLRPRTSARRSPPSVGSHRAGADRRGAGPLHPRRAEACSSRSSGSSCSCSASWPILVGAFTIFNTLSITVAQRSREFGLLRMVGAARRQVPRLRAARGAGDRPARLADRARRRLRHRQGPGRRVRLDGPRPARGGHGVRRRARSSSRCSSARSSRCSRA